MEINNLDEVLSELIKLGKAHDRVSELKLELAKAKKELEDYRVVTKITLGKLQTQLQLKENE